MDTLSKRYGCPFFVIQDMIRLNQLHDFITEVFGTIRDEKEWEFFLHKVYDKTFDDFRNDMKKMEKEEMTTEQIASVVDESASMLDLF